MYVFMENVLGKHKFSKLTKEETGNLTRSITSKKIKWLRSNQWFWRHLRAKLWNSSWSNYETYHFKRPPHPSCDRVRIWIHKDVPEILGFINCRSYFKHDFSLLPTLHKRRKQMVCARGNAWLTIYFFKD